MTNLAYTAYDLTYSYWIDIRLRDSTRVTETTNIRVWRQLDNYYSNDVATRVTLDVPAECIPVALDRLSGSISEIIIDVTEMTCDVLIACMSLVCRIKEREYNLHVSAPPGVDHHGLDFLVNDRFDPFEVWEQILELLT